MAEENINVTEGTESAESAENTRTIDDVLAELEQAKRDRDRYKSANDNLAKENAEAKRKARDRMSEDEKRAEEQAEKEAEYQQAIAELNHLKAVKHYESLVDEKSIDKLIDAISVGKHEAIAKIIADVASKAVNDYKVAEMKSDEGINHGQGSAMTKEQILSIADSVERQKAIAENISLFY